MPFDKLKANVAPFGLSCEPAEQSKPNRGKRGVMPFDKLKANVAPFGLSCEPAEQSKPNWGSAG